MGCDQEVTEQPSTTTRTMADRARTSAARYAQRLEVTTLGRMWSRLLEVEFVDRSIALAAKAFVSFLPLLVIVSALSPDNVRDNILTVFSTRFGVSGAAYATVTEAFTSPEQTKTAAGIVGTLTTVVFAVSFTTALQRVFLRAWRRPPGGGARNQARGAAWLGAVLVLLLMVVAAGVVLTGPVGSVFYWALGLLACTALWWWTARLMVRGEVRWRALLPTAIVMGIGGWMYTVAAAVWMPADVASQYAQFGAFGITQSFVTWFTGMAFLLIFAAVLGPALADGHHPLARWLRSGNPTAVEAHAAPALPGPARPVRLSDAFGRGNRGSGVPMSDPVADDTDPT